MKPTDRIVLKQALDGIHYIGDYSLAVKLFENAHALEKNNIETGEWLYFSYFCTVLQRMAVHRSATLRRCATSRWS